MSASNNYSQQNSNALPPRSQTRSSSVRVRSSRTSTTDHMLHRTLPSRSPSSSSVVRRRRESLSRQNNGMRKTTSTSNIQKTLHSLTSLSSINNSQHNLNPDNDEDDNEIDISDIGDFDEIAIQNQSNKENISSSKYPFEVDKNPVLKQRTSSGKKLAQEVLEMYEQQLDGSYKCTQCTNKVKIIKQTGRGTANLRSHLLAHGLKNFAFDSQEEQRNSKMNHVFINRTSLSRKSEIDAAILKCTIEAGLPFNLFNHVAVVDLLRLLEPGYTPPDRHTLSSRIHDQYYRHIFDLKSVLPHVGPVAFSSDLWKDVSRRHIISLSLHTFSVDFEFISLPLSFHLFQEQKLAINIQAFFEYERERFGLNSNFLSGIATDNGPDIKCASSSGVLGPRFACIAHCLNLVVHHGVCLWDLPNPKRFPFDSMYEPVNTSLVDDEDEEITSEIPSNGSSSAMADQNGLLDNDTQQLVDDLAFPETNTEGAAGEPVTNQEIFDLLNRFYYLIQKVRDFVSMTRAVASLQRYITERTDSGKAGFVLDVKVRWNSSFKMIDRLISLRDLVNEMFNKRDFTGLTSAQKRKFRSLVFTHDDWDLLNAVRDCLQPFEKITAILSGDYPTQSMSYYALQVLKASVAETSNQSYYQTVINKSLSYQYDYYLDAFLPIAQKFAMKVAAFLDPLFHGDILSNKNDYETAKHVISESLHQMNLDASNMPRISASSTLSPMISTSSSNRMLALKSSLMSITNKTAPPPLSSQPVTVDLEMATFLNLVRENEMISFQAFWKDNCRTLPRLTRLVRQYNMIPATSVFLEQTFSVAGAIKNVRRASMSSLTLRSLMILKKKKKIEQLRSCVP